MIGAAVASFGAAAQCVILGVVYAYCLPVVKAVQAKRRKAKGKVMKRPPDALRAKEKSEKRLVQWWVLFRTSSLRANAW